MKFKRESSLSSGSGAWWRSWRSDQLQSMARILQQFSTPLMLFILMVFFSFATEQFLSIPNLLKIVNEAAVIGTLALGMTFVLILAGVDLSVSATASLTTVVLGLMLVDLNFPIGLALLLGLLTGCVVGLVNGLLVANTAVPPVLVTLGMLYIAQSIAFYITGGAITSLSQFDTLVYLGQGNVGPIPVPAIILLILAAICYMLLNYTNFGTKVRAVGSNRKASALMGLDVSAYTVGVYLMSGLLASIGGLILAGRLAATSSDAALTLVLNAIAAAVLGGASLFGGSGSIIGTLAGALVLSTLFNGLVLMGASSFYQLVFTGLILILVLAFNEALRRRT